jgi:hypothetical protein
VILFVLYLFCKSVHNSKNSVAVKKKKQIGDREKNVIKQ